jgi:hypothetical protein
MTARSGDLTPGWQAGISLKESCMNRESKEGPPKPPPEESIRIVSGETFIFAPAGIRTRRQPMVTIGRFRDGRTAVHFRQYAQHSPGVYAITHDGISLTIAELSEAVRRLHEVFSAVPELATEKGAGC